MTAEEIIKAFMAERKIARSDLCHSQMHRHLKARRVVIDRLRKEGFGVAEIARAMGKHASSIKYWTGSEWASTKRWSTIASEPFPATESNSIVLQVCNKHGIYHAELLGAGRDKRLTSARREAIERMDKAGFYHTTIARLLNLSYSTVRYWVSPSTREYSNRIARASLARSIERRASA